MFNVSTAWNNSKDKSAFEMVSEIKSLGFKGVELNFSIDKKKSLGFLQLVKDKVIQIDSVHNYCPYSEAYDDPKPNPDFPSLSSVDEKERQSAVSLTKDTIIYAGQVNARVVVAHGGFCDIQKRTRELIKLALDFGVDSKEFRKLKSDAIDDREQNSPMHFESLCTSLSELVPLLKKENIRLGMENRFYYRELPSPAEFKKLLAYFSNDNVAYWHDTGHAFVLESLGFYETFEYLRRFNFHMLGVHIHDILRLNDHRAPFTGDYDWIRFKSFVRNDHIKVIEVGKDISVAAMLDSKKKLKQLFID